MGKPGNKNQSSMSNIFKRVPNANYESTEAIVPGIGSMGEQSSEDVYMSDPDKSPLQQKEPTKVGKGAPPATAGMGGPKPPPKKEAQKAKAVKIKG